MTKDNKKSKNTQSRKWQITINNPIEKGFNHSKIKEILYEMNLLYWCMSDEIGKQETYHTHIYIVSKSAIRFSKLKNCFEGAHFEKVKGTSIQNRDYIFKVGKWGKTEKEETNLKDTQEEWGEIPNEKQGRRSDIEFMYDAIKEGKNNFEILEKKPVLATKIDTMDKVRKTILEEKYKTVFRKLEVIYIYGKTETGKTRGIMEQYGYSNVCQIANYQHPFDNYKQQPVIIFDEFRSDLKIGDMLKYLDGYPLFLPCRYMDKVACFDKIYIVSNISLEEQYPNIQKEQPESWKAFIRRIHKVKTYNIDNKGETEITEFNSVNEYIHRDIKQENSSSDFDDIDEPKDAPF